MIIRNLDPQGRAFIVFLESLIAFFKSFTWGFQGPS